MTETVISCQKVKDWTTPDNRILPIYQVNLSDGRGGESFKEIPPGTPMSELSIEATQYGNKIKWNKPGSGWGGGGKRDRGGNESFAMSYSKDLVVGGKVDLKHLFTMADKIYVWLEGKKAAKPAGPAPVPATPVSTPIAAPPVARAAATPFPTDDLPF